MSANAIEPDLYPLAAVVADTSTGQETDVLMHTPEWDALLDWLRWHSLDPDLMPAGCRIVRDPDGRCIRYRAFVGERTVVAPQRPTAPAVEQGEAAPLPFPELIARRLR